MTHPTDDLTPDLFAPGAGTETDTAVQDEADLKTRFIVADSFEIGIAPANRAFVHAQLRLLAGRTPEAKTELAGRIAAVLRERTPRPQGVMVQLSVEIVDMDRPCYVKERL